MTRAWGEDLSGQKFNRLTAVRLGESKNGQRHWICQCECGKETTVSGSRLKNGIVKSCGCLRSETTAKRMTRHGQATRKEKTQLYKIWNGMVARCTIPSATGYERYGGAGIKVCERWLSFENFAADMGDPPEDYSIDRKDSTKGYEPENCRWAGRQEQNENRKSVRVIEFDGKSMNVTQWARHLGINKATLLEALDKYPLEVALRARTT